MALLAIVLVILASDFLWINIPKFKAHKQIDDVYNYAQNISNLDLKEGTRVIGLGEATHGNADFKTLKLEVLKNLVEDYGLRSFSLEADFGEGLTINNYIHGDKKDENVSNLLSFEIYHTKEMNELINWMFDYNQNKKDEDKLSFYGIDMQNPEKSIKYLVDFSENNEFLVDENLDEKFSFIDDANYKISQIKENEDLLKSLQTKLDASGTHEAILVSRAITNIIASIEYYESDTDDYVNMNNMRDKYMAENVRWISDFEKTMGNDLIFITGHNGHIAKKGEYYKTLGSNLNDIYNDTYLAIGTDFYKTTVNINTLGSDNTRTNQKFTSANPLAYQAKNFGGSYLLIFDLIKEGQTYNIISSDNYMGSLGEGYSPLMKLIPTSYRIKDKPLDLFDAMIYVYEAQPIEVIE